MNNFKVTVTQNGSTVDELETDCFIGAAHDCTDGTDKNYFNLFYAEDCDVTTVVRVIRTMMRFIKEKAEDPDIMRALMTDTAEAKDDDTPLGGLN